MSAQTAIYFSRYLHNLELSKRIESTLSTDIDWASVALFYSAVHLMNSYLVNKANITFDPNDSNHQHRWQAFKNCPELNSMREKYRELKDLSEQVRYDASFVFNASHLALAKTLFTKCESLVAPKVKKIMSAS